MRNDYVILLTTVTDMDLGKKIARELLEKRLIACSNIYPSGRSLYWWEGKICDDQENVMMMKTRKDHIDTIKVFFKTHHPYRIPELIALDITAGSSDYFAWLDQNLEE